MSSAEGWADGGGEVCLIVPGVDDGGGMSFEEGDLGVNGETGEGRAEVDKLVT
jgi:hypothetical protein